MRPLFFSHPMNTDVLQISLRDMQYYAYHGVMPQEQEVGGEYRVSVTLDVSNTQEAVYADSLEGTVNYAHVQHVVSRIMATPSKLLEHVAGRIARRLFSMDLRIRQAEINVTKCCPPIAGSTGSATCTLRAHSPFAEHLRLVILDFDGTLADTTTGIITTMQATFNAHQMPQPEAEAITRTIGLPLSQSIALLAKSDAIKTAQMVATYRQLFEEVGTKNVTLFPGIKETLATLKESGIMTAIATSRGHQSVESLCQNLGIAPWIDFIVAEDDVHEKKPAPEAILRILDHMQIQPNEALMVGDTTYDVAMGLAARCPTMAITYGNHDRQTLELCGADLVCNHFENMLSLFK